MSFKLTDLRKKDSDSGSKIAVSHYIRNIVLGTDFFSVIKFLNLRKELGPEVKLVGDKPLTADYIKRSMASQIKRVRTQAEVDSLKNIFPHLELTQIESEPKFYKDGEIKVFGGKSAPMEILDGEETFINKPFSFDLTKLISNEDWANLDQIIKDNYLEKKILNIKKILNDDLVEPRNFSLTTGEQEVFITENLVYGAEIKSLLNLFSNKDDLGPETISYLSSINTKPALLVNFKLAKQLEDDVGTFLFPRSQTHEWGHFVFEFYQLENDFYLNGLIIIHDEDFNEEDLAKKIRQFKTTLKRFYGDLEENIEKENIFYDAEYIRITPENSLKELPNLHIMNIRSGNEDAKGFLVRPFKDLC